MSLYIAIKKLRENYNIQKPIIKNYIAAVSAGIVDNKPLLDLDYNEDSAAEVDANFVMTATNQISEVQVTGEEFLFEDSQLNEMLDLAKKGIREIIEKQKEILSSE